MDNHVIADSELESMLVALRDGSNNKGDRKRGPGQKKSKLWFVQNDRAVSELTASNKPIYRAAAIPELLEKYRGKCKQKESQ